MGSYTQPNKKRAGWVEIFNLSICFGLICLLSRTFIFFLPFLSISILSLISRPFKIKLHHGEIEELTNILN